MFIIDYLLLAQVSPTKSEMWMQVLEETLLEKRIHLSNPRFSCLDGTNSMSGQFDSLSFDISLAVETRNGSNVQVSTAIFF